MGVTRAYGPIRSRAAWTSVRVGVVFVANAEHLAEDLMDGRQRIERPAPHLVEETGELGVVLYGIFQMAARSCGGDRENLRREVSCAPLGERPSGLEGGPMLLERAKQ